MGCGSSVDRNHLRDQLRDSEAQLQHLRDEDEEMQARLHRAQEEDSQLRLLQGQHEHSEATLAQLRDELLERQAEYAENLEHERMRYLRLHEEESQHDAQLEAEREEHQQRTHSFRESILRETWQERDEAQIAESRTQQLLEELGPLRREHHDAIDEAAAARLQLLAQQEECTSAAGQASSLEQELGEVRENHLRTEQRYEDLEGHLHKQIQELRDELERRTSDLRQRDKKVQDRDHELAEVNSQLAELQSLFDDVNRQLQTECGRIEQLQDTVVLAARQGKELESLQAMLEESHRVLAQMRDALEQERTERVKVSEQLEHEQQRTQLLLDVLKHFKEKLQGLTPQMLLSRLGGADPKALLATGGLLPGHGDAEHAQPDGSGGLAASGWGTALPSHSSFPPVGRGGGSGMYGHTSPRGAVSETGGSAYGQDHAHAAWINGHGGPVPPHGISPAAAAAQMHYSPRTGPHSLQPGPSWDQVPLLGPSVRHHPSGPHSRSREGSFGRLEQQQGQPQPLMAWAAGGPDAMDLQGGFQGPPPGAQGYDGFAPMGALPGGRSGTVA